MAMNECDIIMRGGITSGLVYPGALATLAPHWRFRNIGGASAGAIAAALLAAAEHGRRTGANPDAFSQLAAIPTEMGARGLKRLFPPNPGLEPAMDMLWSLLASRSRHPGLIAAARAAFAAPLREAALLAAGIGIAFVIAVGLLEGWVAGLGWGIATGLLVLALAIWGTVKPLLGLVSAGLSSFTRAGFGLSSGIARSTPAPGIPEAAHALAEGGFADWIHASIQSLAGRPFDQPLTIGELWTADRPEERPDHWGSQRDIDLLLTTTNLGQGLPEHFPFLERPGSTLYFLVEELSEVLPRAIVDHLVDRSAPAFELQHQGRLYHRLPLPSDLPLALGVRMSLSFPALISAVRLHLAPGFTPGTGNAEAAARLQPLLFSDGGITSNFPVSSFDALIPTRPTFCINLADLPPERCGPNSKPEVHIADDNSDGMVVPVQAAPHASATAFAASILDTARNGHENELMSMAGQRDRIVTILLDPGRQGGLNLDMDAATIADLNAAGVRAGEMLNARFAHTDVHWRNHRWLRLRTSLAALESAGIGFAANWTRTGAHGLSYESTEAQLSFTRVPGYRFSSAQRHKQVIGWASHLATEFATWHAAQPAWPSQTLANGARKAPTSLSRIAAAPRPGARITLTPNRGRDPLKG